MQSKEGHPDILKKKGGQKGGETEESTNGGMNNVWKLKPQ